jgi:hypothetical protein
MAALWPLLASHVAAVPQNRVTLTLRAPAEVSLHEPVIVEIVLANESQEPVTADFGGRHVGRFEFRLIDPKGGKQVYRPSVSNEPLTSFISQPFTLGPQVPTDRNSNREILPSVERQRVVLNQGLKFAETGRYSLTVAFDGTVRPGADVKNEVGRLWSREVLVSDRDEARLKAALGNLADQALRCCGVDSSVATSALSAVDDPIVIPYLERVAAAGHDGRPFDGLRRFGRAAVEALDRLSHSPIPSVAANARNLLATIK